MNIRVIVFFALVSIIFAPHPAAAAAAVDNPLRANLFLSWKITEQQALDLARWDLVVLDAEVGARQPQLIKKMRARNPRIKILAYVSAVEIHKHTEQLEHEAPLRSALLARAPESMYVYGADGSALSFWPNARLMNVTGPWQTLLPAFIHEKILSRGVWDGIMLDNVWDGVTWYVGPVDLNYDQIADDSASANAQWNAALHAMITEIKRKSPRALVIGNGSTQYTELDGIVFENFPTHGWAETMARAADFHAINENKITIVNMTAGNAAMPSRSHMEFGLGSALLFDSYFSYDFGDTSHSSRWWYDAYDLPLGPAQTLPTEVALNIWQRAFKHGTVFVNAGAATSTIPLENNEELTLAPQTSKLIMEPIKPFTPSFNHPEMTAEFYQISGAQIRSSLPIPASKKYAKKIPRAPKLISLKKITRSSQKYSIRTTDTKTALKVTITDSKKALVSEWLVTKKIPGENIGLVVRDVNNDGVEEIIILRPTVQVAR